MYKRLAHPNIVPLLGITPSPLQLISEWMPGGDLTDYIKKSPDVNRVGLVSIPPVLFDPTTYRWHQLSGVAEGLLFLHSRNIVHGDLKGVRDCSGFAFPLY